MWFGPGYPASEWWRWDLNPVFFLEIWFHVRRLTVSPQRARQGAILVSWPRLSWGSVAILSYDSHPWQFLGILWGVLLCTLVGLMVELFLLSLEKAVIPFFSGVWAIRRARQQALANCLCSQIWRQPLRRQPLPWSGRQWAAGTGLREEVRGLEKAERIRKEKDGKSTVTNLKSSRAFTHN